MKIFILILLYSSISYPKFHDLKIDYLKNNQDLEIQKLVDQQMNNSEKILESSNQLYLSANVGHLDGRPAGYSAFQADTSTNYFNATLGKKFWWGGDFQFTSGFNIEDISNQNPLLIGGFGGTKANVFSNKIKFSKDLWGNFLGKQYKLNKKILNERSAISKIQTGKISNDGLLELFNTYLNAKFQKSMLNLGRNALSRASKRKRLARNRYNDGLAVKVDKLQSDSSYVAAEENVQTYQLQFEDYLSSLSTLIVRKVKSSDIQDGLSFKSFNTENLEKSETIDQRLLKQNIAIAELESRQAKSQDGIEIKLNAEFSRSGVDPKFNEALGDSFSDTTFDNKAVSLNVVYPLGENPKSLEAQNKRLQAEIEKIRFKKLSSTLSGNQNKLSLSLKNLEKNILMSEKKLRIAKSVLREQSRRYEKGQIEIDQVLISEDSITQTEITNLQYIKNYYQLVANSYFTAGKFDQFIEEFRE